jgi:hypothetical protein
MAGNYFDFGFHQRQALADRLSMMPLHAWLQMQAMRAAEERAKAEENFRQLMLGLSQQRLTEGQKYHKAQEELARERLEQRPLNPAYAVPIGGGRYGIPTSGDKYIVLPAGFKPPTKPDTDPDTAARMAEAREKGRLKAQQEMWPSMPIGQLKGKEVIGPDGRLWPLNDTVAHASTSGALALTPKEADQYRAALSARDGMKVLVAMAHVLPEPGMAAALGPLTRRIREITGDYRVTDFNTAKMALVQYARPLMGTLRVNKQEFMIGLGGITRATSFEAFNHGANLILDSLQRNIDLMQMEGSDALKPSGGATPTTTGTAPMSVPTKPAVAPPPAGFVPVN